MNVYLETGADKTSLAAIGLPGDSALYSVATAAPFIPCGYYSGGAGVGGRSLILSVDGQYLYTNFFGANTTGTGVYGAGNSVIHQCDAPDVFGDAQTFSVAQRDYNGFWYTTGAATARVANGVLAGLPLNTITGLASRLVGAGFRSRSFYWCELADPFTWNFLSTARVETQSGNIVALRSYKGLLVIFCENAIEFWQPTADANNPFAPIIGSTIRLGALNTASTRVFNDSIYFIGSSSGDGVGATDSQFSVYALHGMQIEKLSSSTVERQWNTAWQYHSGFGRAPRIAGIYSWNGHTFMEIAHGDNVRNNYIYDAFAQAWTVRRWDAAELNPPHAIVNVSITNFSIGNVQLDAMQNSLVGFWCDGTASVKLRNFTEANSTWGAAANPIRYSLTSPHYAQAQNYGKMICARLRIDMDIPAGAQGIALEISRDRGITYGSALSANYGQGSFRAEWRRLGWARDFVFRISQVGGLFRCLGAVASLETLDN